MTVAELKERMLAREFKQWDEWFAMQDKAAAGPPRPSSTRGVA